MKYWLVPLMLGFGATMAVVVGQRMSTDAMAIVIGVAVGVAASVPTSALLVALLRREGGERRLYPASASVQPTAALPVPQQASVIVINPADLLGQRAQQAVPLPPPSLGMEAGLRRLRVVGDDDWRD